MNYVWGDGYRVDPEMGVVYGLRGRPLTAHNPQGYVMVTRASKYVASVHRVIWEAVNGPIPEGMQINHINGIKWDNRLANLELVTQSENTKHAYAIGLCCAKGERNGRAIGKRRRGSA